MTMPNQMSSGKRVVIGLFCTAAPFVYYELTTFWRNVEFSTQVIANENAFIFNVLSFTKEIIGAAMAATLLGGALAWTIRGRPMLLAVCLMCATTLVLVPDIVFAFRTSYFSLLLSKFGALLIFYVLCSLVVFLMSRSHSKVDSSQV